MCWFAHGRSRHHCPCRECACCLLLIGAVGEYSEQVLEGLDWLLVEAGRRGLRLMLALTNDWKEFGGMAQYMR